MRKLRLHRDGRVTSKPLDVLARANDTDVAGMRALVDLWVDEGNLRRRPDGGFDVVRFVAAPAPRKMLDRALARAGLTYGCSTCPATFHSEGERDHHADHCRDVEGNPRCVRAHCQEAADI